MGWWPSKGRGSFGGEFVTNGDFATQLFPNYFGQYLFINILCIQPSYLRSATCAGRVGAGPWWVSLSIYHGTDRRTDTRPISYGYHYGYGESNNAIISAKTWNSARTNRRTRHVSRRRTLQQPHCTWLSGQLCRRPDVWIMTISWTHFTHLMCKWKYYSTNYHFIIC